MTALTVSPASAHRTLAHRTTPRPRLLLPPRAEPESVRTARTASHLAGPLRRSVLSPVTEASWPIASVAATVTPASPPDPAPLCGAVVLAAIEAVAGRRPLAQLTRWVTSEVYDDLTRACSTAAADRASAAAAARRARPVAPAEVAGPRAGAVRGRPVRAGQATVRSTVVSRIGPDTVEASVVIHDGDRVRAAAIRLETHRGRWRVTVMQIG